MKIILSRKGFDLESGGYPNPILPDGKMISLPIPSEDKITYDNLKFEGRTYYDLMKELNPSIAIKGKPVVLTKYQGCHLDPDLCKGLIDRKPGWKPLFGQSGSAEGHLIKQKVDIGDLFLFFGTFQKTKHGLNGQLSFDEKDDPKHVLFGFLEIGEKIQDPQKSETQEWTKYHSHVDSNISKKERAKHNALYISSNAGSFCFHPDLVLTKEGCSKSVWALPEIFRKAKISYHSESSWDKQRLFHSVGRGQEFVIQDNHEIEKWTRNIIKVGLR